MKLVSFSDLCNSRAANISLTGEKAPGSGERGGETRNGVRSAILALFCFSFVKKMFGGIRQRKTVFLFFF